MADNPIQFFHAGNFGEAVAWHLKSFRDDIADAVAPELDHVISPSARMVLVASWRPLPKLCDRIDELSHQSKRPFVPLVIDSTSLRLGPVVIPGRGACWRCWVQRSRQHAEWTNAQIAIMKHYAEQSDVGPRGYLEPFALMAAARLANTIAEIDSSCAQAGYIWQIDLLSREITTSTVVGVHGCLRCGMQRTEATRSVDEMQQELQYFWNASKVAR